MTSAPALSMNTAKNIFSHRGSFCQEAISLLGVSNWNFFPHSVWPNTTTCTANKAVQRISTVAKTAVRVERSATRLLYEVGVGVEMVVVGLGSVFVASQYQPKRTRAIKMNPMVLKMADSRSKALTVSAGNPLYISARELARVVSHGNKCIVATPKIVQTTSMAASTSMMGRNSIQIIMGAMSTRIC